MPPPTDPSRLATYLQDTGMVEDAKKVLQREEDKLTEEIGDSPQTHLADKRAELKKIVEQKKKITEEIAKSTKKEPTEKKEVKKTVKPTITANVVGYIIIAIVALIIFIAIYYIFFRRVPVPVQRFPQQMAQAPQMVMRGGAKGIKSIKKQLKRLFK